MLSVLHIEGFRAFREYTVEDLGRVNLFVGRNNSGKTTVLEAAEILLAADSAAAVLGSPIRRGEMYVPAHQEGSGQFADASHLFYGHAYEPGQRFRISGTESGNELWLTCKVDEIGDYRTKVRFETLDLIDSWLDIEHSRNGGRSQHISLMPSGAVPLEEVRQRRPKTSPEERPVSLIRAETPDADKLREFWGEIALSDEEPRVTESLRILEPRIERIAFVPTRSVYGSSSEGIYVRLSGVENRMPLGTLGDGVRHILALSVAVSRSRHGFVMIDEIDTGLHHSVMTEVWRVLITTAERLDVQVFATTHSLDCVRSLAWLANTQPDLCKGVRMHRVDGERSTTVVYGPEEISIAAEQHVETRG
ncbi:MAG: AAA family ATPase [Phycisphaerae bacterium]|nr:AAA family ATPase [Phycisphaerae bacterium]